MSYCLDTYNYMYSRAVMSSDRCWGKYCHGKPVVKDKRMGFSFEPISKTWIRVQGKASCELKTESA